MNATTRPCLLHAPATSAALALFAASAVLTALTALTFSPAAAAAEPAAAKGALRDPTRPLASEVPRRPGPAATANATAAPVLPQLQLVLTSAGRRYAVIDGELYAVGDMIRGMRLLQVGSDAVVLSTPKGPRSLPLSAD